MCHYIIGSTVHWLDPDDFTRKSEPLSCGRLCYPHTFDNIASYLATTHIQFEIEEKLVCTVTDNGSNFGKAFRIFGIDDESWLDNDEDVDQDEVVDFCEIQALPNHVKCASHTLSLLANESVKKALTHQTYKDKHIVVFGKLKLFWRKAGRPKSSEIILAILNRCAVVPSPTRWNSLYDSVDFITEFDIAVLNQLMVALGLETFLVSEIQFLNEFKSALKPVAVALDNLQRTQCYYGILIPTLYGLHCKLKSLSVPPLKYCSTLVNELKKNFIKRFDYIFDLKDPRMHAPLIAVCTHPYFKLRWLPNRTNEDVEVIQSILIEAAKKEATNLAEISIAEEAMNSSTPGEYYS